MNLEHAKQSESVSVWGEFSSLETARPDLSKPNTKPCVYLTLSQTITESCSILAQSEGKGKHLAICENRVPNYIHTQQTKFFMLANGGAFP